MRSSVAAIAVLVLGLLAGTYSADDDDCQPKCEVVKNGTAEWNNGVEIQLSEDVTITVSRVANVIVVVNTKTKLVIAYDTKQSLVFLYGLDAEFGLVIDYKTGACVKVTLDIELVTAGDYDQLRETLDKARGDIDGKVEGVVIISFTYVQQVRFDINAVFESGSETVIAEIKQSYTFVFEICFNAVGIVGQNVNFAGALIVVGIGRVTEVSSQIAASITVVINYGLDISIDFGVFIVNSIGGAIGNAVDAFLKFRTAVKAGIKNINEAIQEARNGVTIDRTITVGNRKYRYMIALVREFLQFVLQLGSINVDVGYSGKTLVNYNANAKIYLALSGEYIFIYSIDIQGGFLFKGSNFVYVSTNDIESKSEGKVIDSGSLAVYVNANAETVFKNGKQISLADLKAALESESKFVAFCEANGINNAQAAFKLFSSFSRAISNGVLGLGGSRLDVSICIRVSFSMTFNYEIEQETYNDVLVTGISNALNVVSKGASSSAIYGVLKGVVGGGLSIGN